jgi:hypothetical protein
MIRHTKQPIGARMALMQQVSRAVVDHWAADRQPQTATAGLAGPTPG